MKRALRLVPVLAALALSCTQNVRYPYLDTRLSFEERAEDLVNRMTLEEKVGQMTHDATAVDHLGIPSYNWWNECLHGVARAGRATVFPQSIGMAATFDRDMIYRMACITSTEARAKYNGFVARGKRGIYQGLTFWSPNINIFRDPRWGRGHETYGEDPYLTGEMGVQFIRGLQGNDPRYLKVVATSKHYAVHSGPESLRHSFDAVVTERDFRDTYLPAFRKTVVKGKVQSVMCAYNRYLGEPCCGSTYLQEQLLRDELGFGGYIVSDCGAIRDFHGGHNLVNTSVEAATLGVLGGTDLNCGSQYSSLVSAVEQGRIPSEEIDTAVIRLMTARMKLGMFDPPGSVPWSDLSGDTVTCASHRQASLEMARKSIVLLKNESGALPLSGNLRRVAVIGPNARNVEVQFGNYHGTPVDPVSVYDGIRNRLAGTAEVRHAPGAPHHAGLPLLETIPSSVLYRDPEGTVPGLLMRFYERHDGNGPPVSERTDSLIDHIWRDGSPPEDLLEDDHYSVEWTGYLVPRRSGIHHIGAKGKYFTLLFEGDTLISMHNMHHPVKTHRPLELREGVAYRVRLVASDRHGDTPITFHWQEPGRPDLREALRLARWADHVVLVTGLSSRLEGEEMRGLDLRGFQGGDRTTLQLPSVQKQLIRSVAATGTPFTVVQMTGSPVVYPREEPLCRAIVQAWYGGESAGTAVADVLFGDYNPAGRLPVTFYLSAEDLPPFEEYAMEQRTYRFFAGEVLYPFGYGLSYTRFEYDNLILESGEIGTGDSVMVSVEVTNAGGVDGEEVVQLYLQRPEAGTGDPLRELRGFERVFIPGGQTRVVTLLLGPAELERFDTSAGQYLVEPGAYRVLVGPSSDPRALLEAGLVVR